METKDLELFLAVARNRSISRTADQLYMSQSTVTNRLQRLERDLGCQLFTRTPGGVQLTEEGKRIYPLAERMVDLEHRMLEPSRRAVRTLRVMSGRAFVSTDVPKCLHQILQVTEVRLQVRMGMYEDMVEALIGNQVDFCFLGEPIHHPRVRLIEYPPDAIDLVVPRGHRFVHDLPSIGALAEEPFIAFADTTAPFRRRIAMLLAKYNVYPDVRMELDSIDGIKAMVAQGLGISLLPRRTLHDADAKGVVAIPLSDPHFCRPTFLAYPDAIEHEELTKAFIAIVTQHYGGKRA
ncbi:LysR family transcriptional regulator [Alicyclobacillus mali]|uniref:LysR family transcriptional regulator n=1 Tax=Alicyclobacillus mali (ex Roth et al. 2021) TaxID=1123961 RepID=A0ABS0F120_9BACL|nr:LysR family transcriptional regulator [Alicyclobacillus mali (ex Roth et al. 2021)]MBF8376955.1 LysR family transcriptional regulator [Alicyclobacillus mali (ex Roth et al. 2021)]MCL6489408.1 LysR family transcriptional regulator [Alicyclobacillus mali (ex Roth et al. 2021)]